MEAINNNLANLENKEGSFLCTKNMANKPIKTYTRCLNKYLKGVPPSILTNIGTKLYTLTSEKPNKIKVIIQITLSPLRYCKYLFKS